jgi:hypothetical protein
MAQRMELTKYKRDVRKQNKNAYKATEHKEKPKSHWEESLRRKQQKVREPQ